MSTPTPDKSPKRFRPFRRFARDERASATVESVLWLPGIVALLALIADASFVFYGKSLAHRIVQDANRAVSIALIADEKAAASLVRAELTDLAPSASVESTINGGRITTIAKIPATDLMALARISAFDAITVTVRSQHVVEWGG